LQIFSRKNRFCETNRHFRKEKIVFATQIEISAVEKIAVYCIFSGGTAFMLAQE